MASKKKIAIFVSFLVLTYLAVNNLRVKKTTDQVDIKAANVVDPAPTPSLKKPLINEQTDLVEEVDKLIPPDFSKELNSLTEELSKF